ncbi:MAG: glutamine-hydrolyzing carbamoyl-phosphate synthase small subunit [Thermoplasmata archaeon]|uniref:Carbamoyl phosphate synthase small chain n=1 Tax=Candidatus Sysuiplasma superficiale TaxID=2823368 RepID=A0A8J7YSN3_9ARCH|nr:glutamine-hydrolyzing carbamoyl-phosphate synthase small subunit [Candidatus Sysuiplasma superficiale]MBX8643837.1 glutamine-hydrolyzing carbamoyl-phosphate synthase small subunit [Candidatus Sysuiplasma superficiale]MCL4347171.1 glutamine-hydrolyzing carbamoyl-phosphate synthase small subunit [Candidatus Thermoplasmatota archaeon]MCL5437317.1 glutamine-hydrolyzing carbamoyl-phosphate synthase small subunit [Candidatus Thermoplasmatota archaeon]
MKTDGILLLEDGTYFEGRIFGFRTESYGEVVFTTSMTGYEESITDPSYRGQILVFTYPLIGNYDFTEEQFQSGEIQVRGIVVSENTSARDTSRQRLQETLSEYHIPGIEINDTRSIVRKVRNRGTMKGLLIPDIPGKNEMDSKLSFMSKQRNTWEENLVAEVSTASRYGPVGNGPVVAVLDFGLKRNLVRDLSRLFSVQVLPYSSSLDDIMELEPEGVVLSSGPGDPAHEDIRAKVLPVVRKVSSEVPILGVCLGHQIVSLAYGAKTFKLKFGHRGINHPVRLGERVYITSQNHGFSVETDSLLDTELVPNQFSLNDGTVEGLEGKDGTILTTQYHPEGGPGPQDTVFVYEYFKKLVNGGRR